MCWRSVRPPADRRCAFPTPPPFPQAPATFRRYNLAFHDVLRREGIAQPPAGDGIDFRQARAADRALAHPGQRAHVGVLVPLIDDVLVDLVHDNIDVAPDAQLRNKLELLIAEHLAARVRGVADQNRLRVLSERVLERLGIKAESRRRERHEHGSAARHDGLRAVVFKIGREHHDFVARVGQGENSVHHRLGRVEVGKALRQIDRAAVDADARHPPDDGVCKMLISSARFLQALLFPFSPACFGRAYRSPKAPRGAVFRLL